MSEKQETTFTRKLVKLLPLSMYIEKTNNPYRRGTPDLYLEDLDFSMWVEMKWIEKPWGERFISREQICKSKSWPLQLRWLQRAAANGHRTAVIVGVGSKEAYIIGYPFDYENHRLMSLDDIIYTILTWEKNNEQL